MGDPTMGDPTMGDPTMGENPTMSDPKWASLRWEMRLTRANTSRSASASSIFCIATTTSERQTRRGCIVIDGHTRRSRRSSAAKSGRSAPKRTIASDQTGDVADGGLQRPRRASPRNKRRLLHPRSLSRVMGSPVSPRRFCSWIGCLERSHGAVRAVHARTRERAAAKLACACSSPTSKRKQPTTLTTSSTTGSG